MKYQRERGRLVDSLIDGHKYVFEKRAIVYGEEDLVIGLDGVAVRNRRDAGVVRQRGTQQTI